MRLIDLVNIILVLSIFTGLSIAMLYSISSYDTNKVRQGIIKTINGQGSNYLDRPYSHDFGNIIKSR